MDDQIQRRRDLRRRFMLELYQRTEAGVAEFVSGQDVGHALELDPAELRRFLEYFHEKGWVWVDDFREGVVRITAAGIDAVESQPPPAEPASGAG